MNTTIGRILLAIPALFILLSGAVFWIAPEAAAAKLLFDPQGAEALSNIRGFVGAPVIAAGASLLLAAITKKLEYARPTVIFLLALLGARVVSYVVDGPTGAIALFLAVPATALAFMIAGHVLLDRGERAEARTAPAHA